MIRLFLVKDALLLELEIVCPKNKKKIVLTMCICQSSWAILRKVSIFMSQT